MTNKVVIDNADDPRVADYVGLADADLRARFEDAGAAVIGPGAAVIGPGAAVIGPGAAVIGPGAATPRGYRQPSPHGRFVAEGLLAVAALARSPYRLRSILVTESKQHRLAELGPLADDVDVYIASQAVLEHTVGFALHRGIVAVGERLPALDPATIVATAGQRPLLVLEALNDHENLGVVFRNAAAFGVGGVLLDPRCADPLYRRCVRVSLGHVLAVPFARVPAPAWPSILHQVTDAGYETVALSPGGDIALHDFDPARCGPVALLAGAEGPGLSAEALAAAKARVRIPLAPSVDSLNVGTATAIALHWFTCGDHRG